MRLSGLVRQRMVLVAAVVAAAAAAVALAGCGSSGGGTGGVQSDAPRSSVLIADAWVRATDGTDDPSMTAAFGVLTNGGTQDRTIVSATNSASDRTELHEMAMEGGVMVMRPIEGGIAVPARGSTTLEPGGLHVMIMDLDTTLEPGDDITVTLTFDDSSTLQFSAQAKEFAGGNEEYSGGGSGHGGSGSSPMPMGSMSGHSG